MIEFHSDWITDIEFVQRDVNQLLNYFAGSKPPSIRFSPVNWEPAIDIYETEREVVITVELAGVKEKDIQIVADRNTFSIRGERRKKAIAGSGAAYYQMEIPNGVFARTVTLPVAVDPGSARATYSDGLLEVVLPKMQKQQVIRVEIKPS